MFTTKEEYTYNNEEERWLAFWIGWMESYISNNYWQKIEDHLDDLKKLAKSQFISSFENYKR